MSFTDNISLNLVQELKSLCSRAYWRNKKLPILVEVSNSLEIVKCHKSNILELYSLDVWLASIDIKNCIRPSIELIDKPKRQNSCSNLNAIVVQMLLYEYSDYFQIYTDGSKASHGVGAALYEPQSNLNVKFKLNGKACIMRAELTAIIESLSLALSLSADKIVILSDSRSALQHLMRCVTGGRGMPIAYDMRVLK